MMTNFTWHADPAHAWLEVDWTALRIINMIPGDFSRYSYRKGNTFYLEEDCDAPRFIARWEDRFGAFGPDEIGELYTPEQSHIRSMKCIHD